MPKLPREHTRDTYAAIPGAVPAAQPQTAADLYNRRWERGMSAVGSIRELSFALFHRWEPERIFVILTSYFDESGTHAGSPATVMAGVMGNVAQWNRFERGIATLKWKHGFRILHTKDFKQRTGEFSGWSPERCLRLIDEMADITAVRLSKRCLPIKA